MPGGEPLNPEPQALNSWSSTIERDFFFDNLLVRMRFIMAMIWWTGLAPWEFESPFPGSLSSSFLHLRETSNTGKDDVDLIQSTKALTIWV